LIDALSPQFAVDWVCAAPDGLDLLDAMLLDEEQTEFRNDVVYCGYASQLAYMTAWPAQCLLAKDSTVPASKQAHNIAFVPEQALFRVFNLIRSLIEAAKTTLYDELVAKADLARDIDVVLDEASVKQGRSLILLDSNFAIVSTSKTIPVSDSAWESTMARGYCSYEMISEIMAMDSTKQLHSGVDIVEAISYNSPNREIAANVMLGGTRIGYLIMIADENPLNGSHFLVMENIVRAICYTIDRYARFLFSELGNYENILFQLLIEAPLENMQKELSSLAFPPRMAALCIRPTRPLGQKALKEGIGADLAKAHRNIQFTYHNGAIAAVLPLELGVYMPPEKVAALAVFAEKDQVRIGVSYTFFSIKDFPTFFGQAQASLDLSLRLNTPAPIVFYREYLPYVFVAAIGDSASLDGLRHPLLHVLRQFDRENNADLYKTLRVYLNSGCSTKAAAHLLFVHRNTLVSRLERIKEIGGIDINDPDTVLLLRMSYYIDRYIS